MTAVGGVRRGAVAEAGRELTILGDVHPYGVVFKCVLVGIEALERVLVARVLAIHRGIVLVPKDDARAGDAFAGGLCALAAHGLLLVTLQLSLAAGEAGAVSEGGGTGTGRSTYHPVRERISEVVQYVWVWLRRSGVEELVPRRSGYEGALT